MRRGGTWLATAGAVLALAACGGGDARPEEPGLPRALAERLARESEAVADKLDAGDQCGAAQQADVLESAVEDAIASGDIPTEFQSELLATAKQLQREINCPQPPPPPPADDCDALEEEKKALEEQKEEADEEEQQELDEQLQALQQQIDESCKGNGKDKGKNGNGDGGDD